MQNKQSVTKGGRLVARGKAQSFTMSKPIWPSLQEKLEFSSLSSSTEYSQSQGRRVNAEQLMEYTEDVLEQVYKKDEARVKHRCREYIRERGSEMRGKVQERLSMLKYLQGELKYRTFAEIQLEVAKQWRKNPLLFSLGTLWTHCMLAHPFKSPAEFAAEYHHMRSLIANLSFFYFKGCLKLLQAKSIDCLSLLYEETAHHIIGSLKEWGELYKRLLDLLRAESGWEMNLDFDLHALKINSHYLRTNAPQNQLPQTTALISKLAAQRGLFQKIDLFKRIRQIFLDEIKASNNRIVAQQKIQKIKQFQKDDVLDCMIYCIVKGQIAEIGLSLNALGLLIGKDSDLLWKKGVDSYRADLLGAVQYLCEDQLTSPLIKMPKNLLSTRITSSQQQ